MQDKEREARISSDQATDWCRKYMDACRTRDYWKCRTRVYEAKLRELRAGLQPDIEF